MQDIHDKISFLVRQHLPSFYEEEGQNFVDFVQSYFEFLEEEEKTTNASRQMFLDRDIDTAGTFYLDQFRAKYLKNLPKIEGFDDAFLIKNIQSLYKSKGSQQSIETLIRIMFNAEADISYPGDNVIRPSSAEFVQPRYLELEVADKNPLFVGTTITGATSRATAFVENISRIRTKDNRILDVAFLSEIKGRFLTNEIICDKFLDSVGSPKVIGSLTSLDIINGGANFEIGDEFDVVSSKGFRGRARVTAVVDETGRVRFELVDGGTGYTLTTTTAPGGNPVTSVIISNNVIVPANTSDLAEISRFDSVQFPLAEIELDEGWQDFSVGDHVDLCNGPAANVIANTFVVSRLSTNTLIVSIESNTDVVTAATLIINPANTNANAGFVDINDRTVTANVTGVNAEAFGVHGFVGGDTIYPTNSVYHLLYANGDINISGNVSSVSSGSGATFDIGALVGTETIAIYTDLLGSSNDVDTPYMDPSEAASFDSVNDTLSIGLTGLAPSNQVQVANGEFQDAYVIDGGSGYIVSDTITVDSTKYSNGTAVVGDQGSGLDLQINTVDGNGAITAISVANGGVDYTYLPEITITSANGTGAEITPLMGYGFPKLPTGNLETPLTECLQILNAQVGTIGALKGINPGSGYNTNPFVVVLNPYIAGFQRKDFSISLVDVEGAFRVGEQVTQDVTIDVTTLTLGTAVSNTTNYLLGEGVTQQINSTANVVGEVASWDANTKTIQIIALTPGDFIASGNNIVGLSTSTEYNVTGISASVGITNIAKGVVKDVSEDGNELEVQRRTFNQAFATGGTLTGTSSSATGTIVSALVNQTSNPMGDNAIISSEATVADGIVSAMEIVDSGIGYEEGENVSLENDSSDISVSATSRLGTAGIQAGYWRTEKHFTNSDRSIIQDNNYYQEFSYVVKTGISLIRYEEALKELLHVAGTKLFGEVYKVADVTSAITSGTGSASKQFVANTDSVTAAGSNEVVLETNGTDNLSNGMVVTGTYNSSVYAKTLAAAAQSGANTLVLTNLDFLGTSTYSGSGLVSDSSNWYDPFVIQSGGGIAGGTVITAIDRSTNTISIQNSLTSNIANGTSIQVEGPGSIPANTVIEDINTGTYTITLSKNVEGSIPTNTTLTFKGST